LGVHVLEIKEVHSDSIASEIGLLAGDQIITINGVQVNDLLDYRFYAAEEKIELLLQRNADQILFEIEKAYNEDIGIEVEEMQMMSCGNACVFCFVFQNPKGLRRALYFKDEDYRFSFLYGHYVTLTTVSDTDLKRIVDQQLSPLYISVHATEEKTRRLLLGIKHDDRLLEKIRFLVNGGIELHTQIVLCPGINDGAVFDQTVSDLKKYYPGVRSIAIVPVGLTRHRKNLFPLRIHTTKELRSKIDYTNHLREKLRGELSEPFVYLADEFFIKADISLPAAEYYGEFYQIENGVGEFRAMIDDFDKKFLKLPESIPNPRKITWVTGTLAARPLDQFVVSKLRRIRNLKIDLLPIRNEFYGNDITVSGLLVGSDISHQLTGRNLGDIVLLPPRVLNHDGFFLDNWSVSQIEETLQVNCHVFREDLSSILSVMEESSVKP